MLLSCNLRLFTTEQEFEIIAGHSFPKEYEVVDESGSPVDLTAPGFSITWSLAPFGTPEIVLAEKSIGNGIELSGSSNNEFIVNYISEDTAELSGLHIIQIGITDPSGQASRTYEGTVVIRPQIGRSV